MKNRIKIIGIALIIAGGFSSCKKEEKQTPMSTTPPNSITQGKWIVSAFTLNGVDHTDFYNGYTFVFNKSGKVNVEGKMMATGIWSESNTVNTKNYNIHFGSVEPLSLLNNEKWLVISQNEAALELEARRDDDGKETIAFSRLY